MAWTNPGDPIQITDFTVDFSDPANPDVQLKTGDTSWNVRSQLGASLGNIGNITLDPTVSTANFDLTIASGTNPGAANVASINMAAAGWTGHSSFGEGAILGNLVGNLTLVNDSTGAGGEIRGGSILPITIWGDVSGDIAAQVITDTGLYVKDSVFGDMPQEQAGCSRPTARVPGGRVSPTLGGPVAAGGTRHRREPPAANTFAVSG
jgi:hypothetical protein